MTAPAIELLEALTWGATQCPDLGDSIVSCLRDAVGAFVGGLVVALERPDDQDPGAVSTSQGLFPLQMNALPRSDGVQEKALACSDGVQRKALACFTLGKMLDGSVPRALCIERYPDSAGVLSRVLQKHPTDHEIQVNGQWALTHIAGLNSTLNAVRPVLQSPIALRALCWVVGASSQQLHWESERVLLNEAVERVTNADYACDVVTQQQCFELIGSQLDSDALQGSDPEISTKRAFAANVVVALVRVVEKWDIVDGRSAADEALKALQAVCIGSSGETCNVDAISQLRLLEKSEQVLSKAMLQFSSANLEGRIGEHFLKLLASVHGLTELFANYTTDAPPDELKSVIFLHIRTLQNAARRKQRLQSHHAANEQAHMIKAKDASPNHEPGSKRPEIEVAQTNGTAGTTQNMCNGDSVEVASSAASRPFGGDSRNSAKRLWLKLSHGLVHKAYHSEDDPAWPGKFWTYCPACRRPIDATLLWHEPVEEPEKGCTDVLNGMNLEDPLTECCCFVSVLFGCNAGYFLGALVLGCSIRKNASSHHVRVLLITPDVPEHFRPALAVYWELREVEYIHPMEKDGGLYLGDMRRWYGVFTKLHVLSLIEFGKVLFLDIDLIVLDSVDELFELRAPAAARTGNTSEEHGSRISGRFIAPTKPEEWHRSWFESPWTQSMGHINAGVMLFQPCSETHEAMLNEVADPFMPEHVPGPPEQAYLSRYYADEWSCIGRQYNFQLYRAYDVLDARYFAESQRGALIQNPQDIRVAHYSGDKPWDLVLEDSPKAGLSPLEFVQKTYGVDPYEVFALQRRTSLEAEDAEKLSIGLEKYGEIDESLLHKADGVCAQLVQKWLDLYEIMRRELLEAGHGDVSTLVSKLRLTETQPCSMTRRCLRRLRIDQA